MKMIQFGLRKELIIPIFVLFCGLLSYPGVCGQHVSGIYHVASENPNASDGESVPGNESNPFKTIGRAIREIRAGDIIIIHKGIYRESIELTTSGTEKHPITIQAAKNENVILSGSELVTSWVRRSQNIYVHNGWPYYFGRWKETIRDARDKARNQVYVNGRYIEEVPDEKGLKENSFFIDKGSGIIFLKLKTNENPSDDSIEVSARDYCLRIRANHIIVRNIHIEYGANGPQKNAMFRVVGNSNLVENCSVEWAAGSGFSLRGHYNLVRGCRFNHNGQTGFGCSSSAYCQFVDCETSFNNLHPGKTYSLDWEAGGNKIALSKSVDLLRHTSIGNNGVGIWYDISNDSCEVMNCFTQGNSRSGLSYEISYRLYAHDNVMIGNGQNSPPGSWGANGGITISSSPGCIIERNILINNAEGFQFREQNRETYDMGDWETRNLSALNKVPVWNHDDIVRNNIIAYNTGAQVRGWFDVSDGRQWPSSLRPELPDNEKIRFPVIEKVNEQDTTARKIDPLTLESLNIIIDNNCYWDDRENRDIFQWGAAWKFNLKFNDLKKLTETLGFERNGKIVNPDFNNPKNYDFRIHEQSRLILNQCYPRGKIPHVKLGILNN